MGGACETGLRDAQKLYLMKSEFGLTKIGISKHPSRRAAELTASSGVRIEVLGCWETSIPAITIERHLHGELGHLRACGEWFVGVGIEQVEASMKAIENGGARQGSRTKLPRFRADSAFATHLVSELKDVGLDRASYAEAVNLEAVAQTLLDCCGLFERALNEAIIAAEAISGEEAASLRSLECRTQDKSLALVAYSIRQSLGVEQVTSRAIAAWDEGRGPLRMDRFSAAALGINGPLAAAYCYLFDGITVAPGLRITDAMADQLIERVITRRQLLAYLGIVPAKFGAYLGVDRDGEPKPFPKPKQPQRDVGEIFRAMGLQLKRRRNRHTNESWYELEADFSYTETKYWAMSRNAVALNSYGQPGDRQPDFSQKQGTVAAMREARAGNLKKFSSVDDLMADLHADD